MLGKGQRKARNRLDWRATDEREVFGCVTDPDVRDAMLAVFQRKGLLSKYGRHRKYAYQSPVQRSPAEAAQFGHVTEQGLTTARKVRATVAMTLGPEAASTPRVPHLGNAALCERASAALPQTLLAAREQERNALRLMQLSDIKHPTVAEKAELNRRLAQMIAEFSGLVEFKVQGELESGASSADIERTVYAPLKRVAKKVENSRFRAERKQQENAQAIAEFTASADESEKRGDINHGMTQRRDNTRLRVTDYLDTAEIVAQATADGAHPDDLSAAEAG